MPPEPTTFDLLLHRQADAVRAAVVAPVEPVAATVRRVDGFANAGVGASGHHVAIDEPAAFGGGGGAADPAELLLIAVGASLSVTLTVHASLQAVTLDAIDVRLTGTLDAAHFFTPTDAPGGGFVELVIAVAIASPAPVAAIRDLVATAQRASPVLRSLACTPIVALTVNGAAA